MKIKNVLKIDCKNKDLIRAWNEIFPSKPIDKSSILSIEDDMLSFSEWDFFWYSHFVEREIIKKLTDMKIEFKIHYWDYNGTTKINVLLTDSWNSVPHDNLLGALFEVYILIRKENKWK